MISEPQTIAAFLAIIIFKINTVNKCLRTINKFPKVINTNEFDEI